MNEFNREDRYIVIKRNDLERLRGGQTEGLRLQLTKVSPLLPKREFLVIESDWPEFEPAYQMIEARMTGKPNATQEAWEAAGGNPSIKASHADLLSALRLMNEAEDEAEAKTNQQKLAMDAACGEIALLKEELETYQMSISHQMVRSTIKAFTGEAASGVAAACKASTESGLIATLECAQGDLRQALQIIEKQKAMLHDWYAANADGRILVNDEAYHIVISTAQMIDSAEVSQ